MLAQVISKTNNLLNYLKSLILLSHLQLFQI